MKFLIVGHSHVSCFGIALRKQAKNTAQSARSKGVEAAVLQLNTSPFEPNSERLTVSSILARTGDATPVQRRNSRAAKRINESGAYASLNGDSRISVLTPNLEARLANRIARYAPDVIFALPKGNEYASFGLLEYPEPFRVNQNGMHTDLVPDGAAMVPEGVMRANMRLIAEDGALLYWRALRELTDVPVVMLPPPPAIGDDAQIMAHPSVFKERMDKRPLAPPMIRRQMYELYVDALRQAVREESGHFSELPTEIAQNGYLDPRFFLRDPIHANPAYGSLMLGHLAQVAAVITEQA
ncbi:MAG: hypothetical protein ACU0BN_17630 [Sulfitobacter sp.]|uniref:hypothetical protein n=1 Tax=Sulfitobacter sp. TaxID=1903071 RepID=UPI0040580267